MKKKKIAIVIVLIAIILVIPTTTALDGYSEKAETIRTGFWLITGFMVFAICKGVHWGMELTEITFRSLCAILAKTKTTRKPAQ